MVPPPSPTASPARPVFLLAIAAALGLALSAGSDRAGIATAALDVLPVAALVAVVWAAARARHGERAANGAALALLLFAPVLGAVGGGGALAPLLLIAGAGLTRCLLDPTVQRIGAAGTCLGLAAAVLEVEGVGRVPTLVAMAVAGVALAGWRVVTAERCESRRRVAHGAAASLALVAAVAAAVLAGSTSCRRWRPPSTRACGRPPRSRRRRRRRFRLAAGTERPVAVDPGGGARVAADGTLCRRCGPDRVAAGARRRPGRPGAAAVAGRAVAGPAGWRRARRRPPAGRCAWRRRRWWCRWSAPCCCGPPIRASATGGRRCRSRREGVPT
ncbi:MAG: hypothetical protein U0802_25545 [Candidatus Binatia bacterium]